MIKEESFQSLRLCIRLSAMEPTKQEFSIRIQTKDDMSVNRNVDYDKVYSIQFFKTGTIDGEERCIDFNIYDDHISEESPSVILFAMDTQAPTVILDPPLQITILDNDG